MGNIHTIPLHIGDLITDTMHLSAAELGAYIRLITVHYRMGIQGLPDEDVQLRRITGLDNKTWKNSRDTILAYFDLSGDRRWVHGKVQKVLSKIQSVQEQNRSKALKRWNSPDAAVVQEQSHGIATAVQSISQKPEAKNSGAKAPSSPPTPLPEWLPLEEWQAFKDMRKRMRSTLTPKAEQLAIEQLEKLRAEAEDPKAVIEQSILRGWKSFYKLKGTENENTGRNAASNAGNDRGKETAIGRSKWESAAEQIIAEDRATGRWKGRI